LKRCLASVARTEYKDFEVILIDNGSTDGSPEVAEAFAAPFELRIVRNDRNLSFSDANAQGAAIARGDLFCFLNNDVDPVSGDWLGHLVDTISTPGAVGVGARLIYPRHRGGRRAGMRFADLTVQHAGVEFDRGQPIPMPRAMGAGDDPLGTTATAIAERPALTAACLLIRRDAFEAAGGFSSDFDYGMEDIDLCLRLRSAGGRLIYDGRAVLWHHESATRAADRAKYHARVARNRSTFVDRWGPRLFRDALLDALNGGERFSSEPFHVGITITQDDPAAGYGDWYTGHELGDALKALGWRVTYLERGHDGWYTPAAGMEAVVVLLDKCDIRKMPRELITMAWIRNWAERWLERPWFDEFDLVFASSEHIVSMVRAGSSKVATLLPIATNPQRFGAARPRADLACDVLFVGSFWDKERDVIDALPVLAEHGLTVRVHGRGWDAVPTFASIDRGFLDYDQLPAAYASARVVVDDAASSTMAFGSVNSRVFDALAVGAIVASNSALGVKALFDDEFPIWSDAPSLVGVVEAILRDPAEAAARASEYRKVVLAEHTYQIRARTVRDELIRWASATRFAIRIGVPSWDAAEGWGDYFFARGLQRSLERTGNPTRVQFLPEWSTAVTAREDVSVHLFGLKEAPTRPSQVNLLWHISHPDLATAELYERYDHVFVASDSFALRMAALVDVPVTPLHQATDPERFHPQPGGPHHELLFVANSRSVQRRIVADLAGTHRDLAVYGRGWTSDLIDPRFVKGERIPNADLAKYYCAADIVLNDHWEDMRAEGFISNRLYDALAAESFVISDDVQGLAEEFDGAMVTYRDQVDLPRLIERYLADPPERRRLAARGQGVVLGRHTFDDRVRILRQTADVLATSRPDRILPEADAPVQS